MTGANNPSDNLFQDGDFYTNTEKGDNFQNISNPYDYNRCCVICADLVLLIEGSEFAFKSCILPWCIQCHPPHLMHQRKIQFLMPDMTRFSYKEAWHEDINCNCVSSDLMTEQTTDRPTTSTSMATSTRTQTTTTSSARRIRTGMGHLFNHIVFMAGFYLRYM